MKKLIKVLAWVVGVILLALGIMGYMFRPLSQEEVMNEIQSKLEKTLSKTDEISSILFAVESPDVSMYFGVGDTSFDSGQAVSKDNLFHSASVGKTFTAVVIAQLIDEGKIDMDTKISTILHKDLLQKLSVIDGVDYIDDITINHLLTHTSGIADYFEDPVITGEEFLSGVMQSPDRAYHPTDLLDFTRENQTTFSRPGQVFHYSDTGYVLLGLIIETIDGDDLGTIFKNRIFDPSNMSNSYLMFSAEDQGKDILGVYLNGIDLSGRNALSLDWGGGGVVTSLNDLILFMRSFVSNRIISEEMSIVLRNFDQPFDKGIYYGKGMMYFDFSELSFMLSQLTDVYGGMGSTGTFILYDEMNDTYYAGNLGAVGQGEKSIQLLIELKMLFERIKK